MRDILFSVGPVEMYQETLDIGSEPLPYFRTEDFSIINKRIADNLKRCMYTDRTSKAALLTSSGTAAMEAAVLNIFNKNDKILIIVGGSFGERFVQICKIYQLNYVILKLKQGENLKKEHLEKYRNSGITGILINIHETSTGVLYDGKLIGEFSKEEQAVLLVDAISSFLADEYKMDEWNIDATIISSQKALALPPGMAAVVVNESTAEKMKRNDVKSIYFNLNTYFEDMERGQTPYTTAVGITLQMDARLTGVLKQGIDKEINRVRKLAKDFRIKLDTLGLYIPSERLSNAITPVAFTEGASTIFERLKKDYHIIVCPSGGQLKDRLLRVGHLGNLSIEDNNRLIEALQELKKRGLL